MYTPLFGKFIRPSTLARSVNSRLPTLRLSLLWQIFGGFQRTAPACRACVTTNPSSLPSTTSKHTQQKQGRRYPQANRDDEQLKTQRVLRIFHLVTFTRSIFNLSHLTFTRSSVVTSCALSHSFYSCETLSCHQINL